MEELDLSTRRKNVKLLCSLLGIVLLGSMISQRIQLPAQASRANEKIRTDPSYHKSEMLQDTTDSIDFVQSATRENNAMLVQKGNLPGVLLETTKTQGQYTYRAYAGTVNLSQVIISYDNPMKSGETKKIDAAQDIGIVFLEIQQKVTIVVTDKNGNTARISYVRPGDNGAQTNVGGANSEVVPTSAVTPEPMSIPTLTPIPVSTFEPPAAVRNITTDVVTVDPVSISTTNEVTDNSTYLSSGDDGVEEVPVYSPKKGAPSTVSDEFVAESASENVIFESTRSSTQNNPQSELKTLTLSILVMLLLPGLSVALARYKRSEQVKEIA